MNANEILDLAALNATALQTTPYEYVVVPNFIKAEALPKVQADYPQFDKPGSIPLPQLTYGPAFSDYIDALNGPGFEKSISDKFSVDLTDRPTMFTVRTRCRAADGKIHSDSVTKIITVLIYMNESSWPNEGGRLRLLRNGTDLQDYAAEVPPNGGTLIAFKRCDHSWHGHEPYEGPRRAIQMNWVTSKSVVRREQFRHKVSTWIKMLKA